VLDGNKVFITNGTDADVALVFASVDLEKKHRGITAFLVEADAPGYSHGSHEFKLGVNASGTTELAFQDMRVPASAAAGRGGRGLQDRHGDARRRPHRHRRAGGGDRPRRVRGGPGLRQEREQFGKAIAEFQAIQFYLADMATELDAAACSPGRRPGPRRTRSATRSRRRRRSSSPRRWRSG
jgi:alkylation response protein AidB-like acyl-CoA dehydrogenase